MKKIEQEGEPKKMNTKGRQKQMTTRDSTLPRLRLAMETDEERKAKLEKMVARVQLRLALETEEERRARLEHLSDNH